MIQHYAPVVGWGGGEEQVYNVDYAPVKTVGGGGVNRCVMLSKGSAFIISTSKVLSPAQAPVRFELMISCLRDRRFNKLSHGARHFQRLVTFLIATRIGDVVEKKSRFHRDLNWDRWIQSPKC